MKHQALINKILFTVGILILYRFGTHIALPLINLSKLNEFAEMSKTGVFGMLNMFSGGSISRMSIFGLGVMPYITSSIVMQLVVASVPSLKQLKSEGEDGQRKISFYTKLLTIVIGMLQGFMFASSFIGSGVNEDIIGAGEFKLLCAVIMTISTMSLIWLGDMCTTYGVGNGTSLIIFTGIVAEAPTDLAKAFGLSQSGNITIIMLFALIAVFVATIFLVVFFERSNRLIYIQYPRQMQNFVGKRPSIPKENYLPLKVNTAGVIPPIFASAILILPATIVNIIGLKMSTVGNFVMTNFTHGQPVFVLCYTLLIVFFSFFYNSVIFDTDDIADNLKKSNVFIPGCRPGTATSALIKQIMGRLSLIGAAYLSVVCIIPELLSPIYGYSLLLGGTGVLIVVNVIIDTTMNIQTSILSSKYEKAFKKYDRKR